VTREIRLQPADKGKHQIPESCPFDAAFSIIGLIDPSTNFGAKFLH
jgi:hypothetical protein